MKLHVLYTRTGRPRNQNFPAAREALLRAGWQRLHPDRPFPTADFQLTARGRPHLPGEAFHFSLAHADGLSVLACAPCGRLGIDLAHLRDAALASQLDASFFTPAEHHALAQQRQTPLQLWTRKEAVLKAAGSGLLHAPEQAEVAGASCWVQGREYWLHSTTFLAEYELAIATEVAQGPLEPLDWTEVR